MSSSRLMKIVRLECVTLLFMLMLGAGFPPSVGAGEWEWQNPLPQGNNVMGLWGSSANDVFVVGVGGAILHRGLDMGDEIAVDFGAWGIWHCGGTAWVSLSASDPENLAGWSGGLAGDFGAYGLWSYDGAEWRMLSALDPQGIAAVNMF